MFLKFLLLFSFFGQLGLSATELSAELVENRSKDCTITEITGNDADPEKRDCVINSKKVSSYQGLLPECFKKTVGNFSTEEDYIKDYTSLYYDLYEYTSDTDENVKFYSLANNNSIPFLCYFGVENDTINWECDAIRAYYNEVPSTCNHADGTTMTISPVKLDTEYTIHAKKPVDIKYTVHISVDSTEGFETLKELVTTIAIARLDVWRSTHSNETEIFDENYHRYKKNWDFVYGITFLLYLWACFATILLLWWLTWLLPLVSCSTKLCGEKTCTIICEPEWLDFMIWAFLCFSLCVGLQADESIMLQLVLVMSATSFSIISSCWYCCCLYRQHCCYCAYCCNNFVKTDMCKEEEKKCCSSCLCCPVLEKEDIASQKRSITAGIYKSNVELGAFSSQKRIADNRSSATFDDGDCRCNCEDVGISCSFCKTCEYPFSKFCFKLNHIPKRPTSGQMNAMKSTGCVIFLIIFSCWIAYFAWTIPNYRVLDRFSRKYIEEKTSAPVAKMQAMMYTFRGNFEARRFDNKIVNFGTTACGKHFDSRLTDAEKKESIKESYIDKYGVDMSIFNETDYTKYATVNDWFSRSLRENKPGERAVRPIDKPENESVIVSPSDCRLVVFQDVWPDQLIWLKETEFSIRTLLGYDETEGAYSHLRPWAKQVWESDEKTNPMGIFRLAPQDYHRYHSPMHATVRGGFKVKSTLHSVSADAMTSENKAIYNTRYVVYMEPVDAAVREKIPCFAYIIIGAVCVGSINFFKNEPVNFDGMIGQVFQKGEEFGFFKFGGSTIALVFPPNSITMDPDLLYSSYWPVENLINMGSQFAVVNETAS